MHQAYNTVRSELAYDLQTDNRIHDIYVYSTRHNERHRQHKTTTTQRAYTSLQNSQVTTGHTGNETWAKRGE